MRERTTWNSNEIAQRTAATSRTADPYAMNQDHLKQQPPADKYLTGDPSAFAEDIHPNDWSVEYAGGQVKRDEIGMPEMRPETFTHPEKTAAVYDEQLLVKKADLCTKVARMMGKGKRFASKEAAEAWVEDQSVSLMNLPDADLINTFQRLANEEQMPALAQQQQQAQQDQQAQQQMDQMAQQVVQTIQAGDQAKAKQLVQAMVQIGTRLAMKKANDQQQGMQQQGQQQQQAQQDQQSAWYDTSGQQQQAQGQQQAPVQAQGQQQAIESQVQQMVQDAIQSQQQAPQMGQQAQQQVDQMLAQQQQAQQQQMPPAVQADDQLLDQMLMGPGSGGGMSEVDIQLDPAPMDVGEVVLSNEDSILRNLFATQESQDAEEAQQAQQQGGDQQKQAHAVRTAATRTVGTRPTSGVPRIGGNGSPSPKTGEEVNRLASLWQTAPDVKEAFGLK